MSNGRKNTAKIIASVALVAGAAGVAGLGTYGAFTSSTTASTNVGTGVIEMTMAAQATRGLEIPVTNMVPGDTAPRAVSLTRSASSEAFAGLKLTTTVTGTGATELTSTQGLQIKIDGCSTAWTKVGATNALTCSTTPVPVLPISSVTQTNTDLTAALDALNATGKVANLRIELSLPSTTDNALQNKTGVVKFDFTATQRAGEVR